MKKCNIFCFFSLVIMVCGSLIFGGETLYFDKYFENFDNYNKNNFPIKEQDGNILWFTNSPCTKITDEEKVSPPNSLKIDCIDKSCRLSMNLGRIRREKIVVEFDFMIKNINPKSFFYFTILGDGPTEGKNWSDASVRIEFSNGYLKAIEKNWKSKVIKELKENLWYHIKIEIPSIISETNKYDIFLANDEYKNIEFLCPSPDLKAHTELGFRIDFCILFIDNFKIYKPEIPTLDKEIISF